MSQHFKAVLEFCCKPHRYFSKKHGLGQVHSDLLYIYQTYFQHEKNKNILDVGCGSGRNLLYLALLGHTLTGIDHNQSALEQIDSLAAQECLKNVQTIHADLNQVLHLPSKAYDFILSTVTLQFLNSARIFPLLLELQQATAASGLHFLVFPIQAEPFSLPSSFTYLAKKEALYHFYQDCGWSILEYKETVGQLHKLDEQGKPIQGLFGILLAQKKPFPR